jgi:hypothetical protein
MSKNILFITENLFKERTGASNAIDAKQLRPMIKVAQDIHIQPTLGSTLYLRLQEGIDDNDLTNNEKHLIDNYITDALIWFTMSMLPMVMGYQLFSKGFLQKTSEESNTPSRSDLELIESKYKSMAEFYSKRMIKYLQENFTLFGEYLNPGSGLDVIFPEQQAYSCPIFIGDYMPRFGGLNSITSGSSVKVVYFTATGGETSFTVSEIADKTILLAMRGGLVKGVVSTPTNDTQYLQIVGTSVFLPTGDIAIAGEVYSFVYK